MDQTIDRDPSLNGRPDKEEYHKGEEQWARIAEANMTIYYQNNNGTFTVTCVQS